MQFIRFILIIPLAMAYEAIKSKLMCGCICCQCF